jgi:hypothetical protein
MTTMQNEVKRAPAEGRVAMGIEKRTSRVPSDVFLWTALGSIAGSLVLALSGKQKIANFVGQWAPTLLILGLYNKVVKVMGHDQYHSASTIS